MKNFINLYNSNEEYRIKLQIKLFEILAYSNLILTVVYILLDIFR